MWILYKYMEVKCGLQSYRYIAMYILSNFTLRLFLVENIGSK